MAPTVTQPGTLTCTGCHRTQPTTAFYAHHRHPTGRLTRCKECVKDRVAARKVWVEEMEQFIHRQRHANPTTYIDLPPLELPEPWEMIPDYERRDAAIRKKRR